MFKTFFAQGLQDVVDVGLVFRFHHEPQHTRVHLFAIGRTVVMHTRYIGTLLCNHTAHFNEFAGLVVEFKVDGAESSALCQATIN